QPVVGLEVLDKTQIQWFSWLMVTTTLISMADRAIALYRLRRSEP
ncbi:MAG: hypothetical protein ACI9B8_000124, partial [Sulfitobacter sp.]